MNTKENEHLYLITIKYSDSFYERRYIKCKRIKATKVYKYYLRQLNRGNCKQISTEILK